MNQLEILETLMDNLKDEEMFEAVVSIAEEVLHIGEQKDNQRMQAFGSMVLGEFIAKDQLTSKEQCERGLKYLNSAVALYQQNASVLSADEYSRINLSLSTLYRYKGDYVQSKRYLEMAKDKISDKKVLLTFYQENATIMKEEKKFHNALDSCKKALAIARQIYRDDDYTLYECQFALAEAYENAGENQQAQEVFNECFKDLDGRDGNTSRMSLTSTLSRALSIKTRTASVVSYAKKGKEAGPGKSEAM